MSEKETRPEIQNPFGKTFEIEINNYLGIKKATIQFPEPKPFYILLSKIEGGKEGIEFEIGEELINKHCIKSDVEMITDKVYYTLGVMYCLKEFSFYSNFLKKKY